MFPVHGRTKIIEKARLITTKIIYIRMDGYVTKTSFGKTLSAELDFFVLLMCFPGKYQEVAPLKNVETTRFF